MDADSCRHSETARHAETREVGKCLFRRTFGEAVQGINGLFLVGLRNLLGISPCIAALKNRHDSGETVIDGTTEYAADFSPLGWPHCFPEPDQR